MNKQEVMDLIKDAGFGFLATAEGNQPRVRPMMPCLTEEGDLLIALLQHSRTIQQVKENPHVEICFVDRKMSLCRLTGKASIINENKEKKEIVWNTVPMLRQFFSGPEDKNFNLMEIATQSIEAMTPAMKTPEKISLK